MTQHSLGARHESGPMNAYINLNDQLTRVKGVGSIQVFGAGQYAIRLWVKPDQLAKLQITVPEIVSAIQKHGRPRPTRPRRNAPAQRPGVRLADGRRKRCRIGPVARRTL